MRSRLLLASIGLLCLLTGCVVPSATLPSTVEVQVPVRDSRLLNSPPPIATPLLPEAGDGPATQPTLVMAPTLAPTAQPTITPTLPPSASPTPLPPAATSTPLPPTVTPTLETPPHAVPTRLIIPAIGLDVPVITVGWRIVEKDGQAVSEWDVPDWRAVGWLNTSAPIGLIGNTVLEGHQDIDGRVFENLENLNIGDTLQVLGDSFARNYRIVQRTIVPEKDQPIEVRRDNARWIGASNDERVTLVTCWPRNDNTHRLILVALPLP